MRKSILSLAIAAALSASAWAAPHTIEAPARMMVLPFRPIGNVGSYGWIGDGVEQSLIVRASQPGATVLTAPPQNLNLNAKVDPVAVAKAAGASSVVSGTFQILNNDVKFDGQILDVSSGQSVGSLSATGPVGDLFKLEDTLAQQLDRVLPKTPSDSSEVVPQAVAGMVDTYQPVYAPSAGSYYSTPDDSYYPRYYSPAYSDLGYYSSGYDNFGYLPFYSGFYFGSGFGYGYHDSRGHYHGWDGHHFTDRGVTLGQPFHHGGNEFGHGGSFDHGWNYHGGVNGSHGYVPVGPVVGGHSHNYGDGGSRDGGFRGGATPGNHGFSVGHAGYQAPPNFSAHSSGNFMGPVATHGIGTPAAAMGSGTPIGGASAGGGFTGGHGGFTGGGGAAGHGGGGGHR